ncbi:uncharacterized protein LOC135683487 [Rhopilema esculentum]|uniref:uncharacterized protein LOC135683487 n=1 Tax=Rhopilema esculentum TaxID=499914 RepID=UPI0031E3FBC6
MLMNAMECYCCEELEGCITALNDPLVLNERPGEVGCITSHPGFEPCCLQPWVLRLTGQRFKRKDKLTYSKIKTEERFLRAIVYRQFTRLVYGLLGNKRIPLPACAYHTIRTKFKTDEEFCGFDDNDD